MRILDEQNVEISRNDVDYELGYLKPDKVFIKHHKAIEEQEEIFHYAVKTFYFEDGSKLEIKSEDDPHVKAINDQLGQFKYIDQGENKIFRGADVYKIIDQEKIEAKEARDEYEDIQRYVLYTEAELLERKTQKAEGEKREAFLSTGPERLDSAEDSLIDIILLVAELIGA